MSVNREVENLVIKREMQRQKLHWVKQRVPDRRVFTIVMLYLAEFECDPLFCVDDDEINHLYKKGRNYTLRR